MRRSRRCAGCTDSNAVGPLSSGKGQAQAQQYADSIDDITKFLNDIDDTFSSVIEQDEEPALERFLDTVRADAEKIMAEP